MMVDHRNNGTAVETVGSLSEIGEVDQAHLTAGHTFRDTRRLDVEALHHEIGFGIGTALDTRAGRHTALVLQFGKSNGTDDGIGIGIFVAEDLNAVRTRGGCHQKLRQELR